MAKLSSYPPLSSTASDTDLVPITSGGGTQNIPVRNLIRPPFVTVGGPGSYCDYITDGTLDNVEIQAALDAINTLGGGEILIKRPSSGIYSVISTMTIGSNTRIIFESGTTIRKANSQNNTIFTNKDTTNGNSGIILENAIIDQNGANQTGGGGCSFTGLFDSRFENCVFEKSRVFNLFVGSLAGTSLTGTLTFTNGDSTVTGSGTLFTTELSVGDIVKSASAHFQRVVSITNNASLELDRAWGWSTETSVTAKRVPANARNRLINCQFKGTVGTSDNVGLGLFDDGLVQGCTSTGSTGYGFGPDHANRAKFIGNTCYDNSNAGIGMETCGYCIVENNQMYRNGSGIYMLSGSYRNIISKNQATKNSNGIVISYNLSTFPRGDSNKIYGNFCEANTTSGINIDGVARTDIQGNTLANNGLYGVRIQTGSSTVPNKTKIALNTCYDDQDTKTQTRGIYIVNGTNTHVLGNTAYDADHVTAGITDLGTSTTLANNITT